MFNTASASSVFITTTASLGTYILTFLGVTVGAWAGFLLLRFGLKHISMVLFEKFYWAKIDTKQKRNYLGKIEKDAQW
jgi:putative Ca2+/H+ antiporter (TMEM165/GDT1 family)